MFIEDLNFWDYIKKEKRPIVLYGMGNASQKIYSLLSGLGIKVSDIFASDEFVRGHNFLGHRIIKFSDICEKYDDCVVLICFATFIPEVLEKIRKISEKFDTYAPYISMFKNELCTNQFIEKNKESIINTYNILADSKSKHCFQSVINYMISGKCSYLFSCESDRKEVFETIIKLGEDEIYLDLGAYNGDTLKEFLSLTRGKFKKIIAFEPDIKNFKKLEKFNIDSNINAQIYPYAVWNKSTTLNFRGLGGRNSTLGDGYEVTAESIDNILEGSSVTYIKMDVEGAEKEAIIGGINSIRKYSPKLAVSGYHNPEDLFTLIPLIKEINPCYKIYLRHHPYIPAFETNIYCSI